MVNYTRQVMLFDPLYFSERKVTIIGLGNIGSHGALTLARMGIKKFSLYDPDTIEEHNLSSQSYTHKDIGESKVHAVAKQLSAIAEDITIQWKAAVYNPEEEDIVIIGVDSLAARRKIAKQLKNPNLIIDGRIGGEQLEIYNSYNIEEWKATIPAGRGSSDPCGSRYISYVSVIIGGLIACQVKKYLREERLDKNIILNAKTLDIIKG